MNTIWLLKQQGRGLVWTVGEAFRTMPLLGAYSTVYNVSDCMIETSAVLPLIWVSSAKMLQKSCSSLSRSLTMTSNSSKLMTEPRGTPLYAAASLDRALPIRTWKVLAASKFLIQVTRWSETPRTASLV